MDYQTIYQRMKDTFTQACGEPVSDDGELGIRMRIIAGEAANLWQQMDYCMMQMFPQTASGEYLDRHGQTRDLVRKKASAAQGVLKFSRTTAAAQDIPIPAGTACTSSAGGGVMYLTTEDGVLAGGSLAVTIPAKASQKGRNTNLTAGRIDTLVSSVAGIQSVTNPENFAGGMEDEDEEVFRRRLLDSYTNVSNGANLKFYQEFALKQEDVWSAKAVPSGSAGNQMTLYISDLFRMTPDSLCQKLQQQLEQVRELNMKITVKAPETVTQNLRATVYVDSMQNQVIQHSRAVTFLTDRIYRMGIGESLNPYSLAAEMGQAVEGYQEIVFEEPTTLVKLTAGQILLPGSVVIKLARKGG